MLMCVCVCVCVCVWEREREREREVCFSDRTPTILLISQKIIVKDSNGGELLSWKQHGL